MNVDLSDLLANAMDPLKIERICGIYFLFFVGDLVYIGQSRDVLSRVRNHVSDGLKKFNGFNYIECPVEHLDNTERELILRYSPRYNSLRMQPKCGPPRPPELPRASFPSRSRYGSWQEYVDACWECRADRQASVVVPGEAALIIGISADRLRNMAKGSVIPSLAVGKRFRFTKEDVLATAEILKLSLTVDTSSQNASLPR